MMSRPSSPINIAGGPLQQPGAVLLISCYELGHQPIGLAQPVGFLEQKGSRLLHDAFSDMPIVGKPQCHIIPLAKEQNQIAMSTGCTLSRIRTGMSPDEMTCAIPASRITEVVEKLEARREANARVASYANADGRRFTKRQA